MSDEKAIDELIGLFKETMAVTRADRTERDAKADMTFARIRLATELIRRGEDPSHAVATARVLADDLLKP